MLRNKRCRLTAMLMISFTALAFSGLVQAQQLHGGNTLRGCDFPPPRSCDVDADCTDTNQCTENFCDTNISDLLQCIFSFTNTDETLADSLDVSDAFDTIFVDGTAFDPSQCSDNGGASDCEVIDATDLKIYAIEGNASCSGANAGSVDGTLANGQQASTVLPCNVGPPTTIPVEAAGKIRFLSNTYHVTNTDDDPLRGIATVVYQDQCESGAGDCDGVSIVGAQGPAARSLVDGCDFTDTPCNDNDVCTTDTCDPASGCIFTPGALDCNDNNVCTTDTCDPIDGCVNTPGALDCNDNDVCTTDTCDPIDGCVNTPGALDCNDDDICTDDFCDPTDGCYHEPADPMPSECMGVEICRTPGFWGARGGYDGDGYYKHGQNVTGAMLPLEVCGNMITNTDTGDSESAIEAICIKGGDPRAKMMRMLMSASLNCALGDCSANTTDLIDYCN